jgi:multicomponent Na+:H+ antiporter subunit G
MTLAINEVIAVVLLVASLFFFLASAIGLLRLPDFYSRLHASGNSETLGLMLACLGLVIYEGPNLLSVKMIIVFLLVFLANPIGTHILGKAALKSGHPVWTLEDKEEE